MAERTTNKNLAKFVAKYGNPALLWTACQSALEEDPVIGPVDVMYEALQEGSAWYMTWELDGFRGETKYKDIMQRLANSQEAWEETCKAFYASETDEAKMPDIDSYFARRVIKEMWECVPQECGYKLLFDTVIRNLRAMNKEWANQVATIIEATNNIIF